MRALVVYTLSFLSNYRVIFECVLSLVMLIPKDVFFLINYLTFAEFFFMAVCIAIIPWLRLVK